VKSFDRRFVVVSGLPASGKTTIARALAPLLDLPIFDKDEVNLHCDCPPHVAADRFLQRRRHPGHLDDTRTAAEVVASIHALAPTGLLAIGEPVVIDTMNGVVPEALSQLVEAGFARCVTRLAPTMAARRILTPW
jgi:predicted kinase